VAGSRSISKQEFFPDFVHQHDVSGGVQEPAQDKFTPLLRHRDHNSLTTIRSQIPWPYLGQSLTRSAST
jgi:hypothetical protein